MPNYPNYGSITRFEVIEAAFAGAEPTAEPAATDFGEFTRAKFPRGKFGKPRMLQIRSRFQQNFKSETAAAQLYRGLIVTATDNVGKKQTLQNLPTRFFRMRLS